MKVFELVSVALHTLLEEQLEALQERVFSLENLVSVKNKDLARLELRKLLINTPYSNNVSIACSFRAHPEIILLFRAIAEKQNMTFCKAINIYLLKFIRVFNATEDES